jgi:hypothetical protein
MKNVLFWEHPRRQHSFYYDYTFKDPSAREFKILGCAYRRIKIVSCLE